MKIALAQINPLVGDFAANLHRILARVEEAKALGCGLVVFSELALSGYPPQDFLERPAFIADQQAALARLTEQVSGIGVVCGFVERHTGPYGKSLHNAAGLIAGGRVVHVVRKRLLPSYDVFDETRYFEPGGPNSTVQFCGLRLGLTVCEDIWNDPELFPRPLYGIDPVAELVAGEKPPELLVNVSASPFHAGKNRFRREFLGRLAAKYRLPLLYVNQVGGQDSLLFDGGSLAFDCQGRLAASAARFREDLLVVDAAALQAGSPGASPVPGDDRQEAEVHRALVMGLRDYAAKCGFRKAVLGLSGGIDSALTCALACEALGPENVHGVAMPSPYTSQASMDDARALATNLGCQFTVIPIAGLFESFQQSLAQAFAGLPMDVTEQNIQARIRGNLLMALSNKFGSLLLTTGNKSEMAVGYCTLYGDMSGGLAVISDVPKMLVYRLSRFVNRERQVIPENTIRRAPSAELAPNQRDQDDLPAYEVLDAILYSYLEENRGIDEIVAAGFERSVVEDVVRRVLVNEHKRKQAPPGLKVTSKSFGPGRRYPTAQNYREGKARGER